MGRPCCILLRYIACDVLPSSPVRLCEASGVVTAYISFLFCLCCGLRRSSCSSGKAGEALHCSGGVRREAVLPGKLLTIRLLLMPCCICLLHRDLEASGMFCTHRSAISGVLAGRKCLYRCRMRMAITEKLSEALFCLLVYIRGVSLLAVCSFTFF